MIAESLVLGDISNKNYTIKIADSEEQVYEALRLRYEVFYKELGRKFHDAEITDEDEFDKQCHHLIVINNSDNKIIGTYRLQTLEQAERGRGFYSGLYFQLEGFPDRILAKGFEVGRACIKKEHRSGRVLYLLWKGFAGYLRHFEKQYLFGNLGIPNPDESTAVKMYSQLEREGYVHPTIQLEPREKYACTSYYNQVNGNNLSATDSSPLLKNYIDVGCKVCSKPAYYPDLNLLYVMILMDVNTISDKMRKLFFS